MNTTERLTRIEFQGLGWRVKLRKKKYNYFLTLRKELVIGNALRQNDDLYYYLVNVNGRKGLLLFLDGWEKGLKTEEGSFPYEVFI